MVPTGLLITILLAAAPLFALGAYDLSFPQLGLAVMVVALLVALLDNLISSRSARLEVSRELP